MSDSVFMVREPGIYLLTGIATSRIKNYKHFVTFMSEVKSE